MCQSVQFSHSVVSESLRPHESQHTRPPCPSPTPGVHSNSCASLGSPLCFSGFWTPVKTLFHPEYFRGTPSGLLPCLQPLSVENLMCLGSGRFRVSCLSTAPGSWKSNVPLADLSQVSPRFVVASSALTGSERL